MYRIFVTEQNVTALGGDAKQAVKGTGGYYLVNTQTEESAQIQLEQGAYEMPQADVVRIFGDKAHLAGNQNCQITKLENPENPDFPFDVVFMPPQADITALRDLKKREAQAALTQAIAEITPYYPTDEKVSFAKQEEEALKYKANPAISETEIPCIAGIARGRKTEISVLADKILAKAASFALYSGICMGRKQRIEDLADKAQTEEEIQKIDVQAIFAEPLQ